MTSKLSAWSETFLLTLVLLTIDNDRVRAVYVIDDSVGLGRMFNGIGGLSGGGVS